MMIDLVRGLQLFMRAVRIMYVTIRIQGVAPIWEKNVSSKRNVMPVDRMDKQVCKRPACAARAVDAERAKEMHSGVSR